MPQGRIILNSISGSKKMPQLKTDGARLLYTWLLTHLDINGCYSADPETVSHQVFTKLKRPIKSVASYLEDMANVGLIILYQVNGEDYLWVPDFIQKQPHLNPKREAFPIIPLPSNEQLVSRLGVEYELVVSNSTLSKVKVKQSKVKQSKGEVKEKEEQTQISSFESPQNQTKRFFQAVKDGSMEFTEFVKGLAERNNGDEGVIKNEVLKFTAYWTERSQVGKYERWELQRTFEVMRRLATWFGNVDKFKGFTTQVNKGCKFIGI
jgi:hypothetical protein